MKPLIPILMGLLLAAASVGLSAGDERTDIHADAFAVRPLLPGMRAPAFEVRDAKGAPVAFDIWFISIDRPELLYESLEQPDIGYLVLSDSKLAAARVSADDTATRLIRLREARRKSE